ncbi:MAG TPA: lytic transglycosylase domain-containing protein [Thermoanaerobaculia bacterium]|nr:lytic transglycosylase domain-containing protein [Thermoanaerobaculia bacterium]
MQSPRFTLLALALLLCLCSVPARAELVILTDGNTMKVAAYELAGEQMRLTMFHGGRMTLPIGRIERVIDDEVEPLAPEPPAVEAAIATAAAVGLPPAIELRFSETQPVPPGPYGDTIYKLAREHQVNPQIVAALIRQESGFNRRAVSHKGARGLMQLMPATAQRFGVTKDKLFDPEHNLQAGIRYLSWLVEQFPNDLARVLAAYNAGENAVIRYGGIPPYRETRNYVKRIFTNLGLPVAELSL